MPNCKPQDEAFQIALKHAGNPDPKHCILIDDMLFNLQAAHKLGFGTIQVSQKAPNTASGVDAHPKNFRIIPCYFCTWVVIMNDISPVAWVFLGIVVSIILLNVGLFSLLNEGKQKHPCKF